jgi:hypothetical protein
MNGCFHRGSQAFNYPANRFASVNNGICPGYEGSLFTTFQMVNQDDNHCGWASSTKFHEVCARSCGNKPPIHQDHIRVRSGSLGQYGGPVYGFPNYLHLESLQQDTVIHALIDLDVSQIDAFHSQRLGLVLRLVYSRRMRRTRLWNICCTFFASRLLQPAHMSALPFG